MSCSKVSSFLSSSPPAIGLKKDTKKTSLLERVLSSCKYGLSYLIEVFKRLFCCSKSSSYVGKERGPSQVSGKESHSQQKVEERDAVAEEQGVLPWGTVYGQVIQEVSDQIRDSDGVSKATRAMFLVFYPHEGEPSIWDCMKLKDKFPMDNFKKDLDCEGSRRRFHPQDRVGIHTLRISSAADQRYQIEKWSHYCCFSPNEQRIRNGTAPEETVSHNRKDSIGFLKRAFKGQGRIREHEIGFIASLFS